MDERGRLPGCTRLAMGLPAGVGGGEAEVGQFVVEQEAPACGAGGHHLARAEGVLDGGGHGQRVALASTMLMWLVPYSGWSPSAPSWS
jgi:hypothetical protein